MANKRRLPVTAIIPTLTNTKGLKLIVDQLLNENVDVVVVDNELNDEKRGWAGKTGITYLPQEKNLGFAVAVNLGAEQIKTEWMLIANDDVEILNDESIHRLLATADENNWMAVSPILKKHNGDVENIGYRVLPIGKVELNFDHINNSSDVLDGLTAAFLLIKREVFEDVGGFDESFVAYLEDVDLFMTLKERGFEFGVDVKTVVVHNHLSTSKRMTGFKEKRDVINWWRIALKHKVMKKNFVFLLERLRNVSGLIRNYY